MERILQPELLDSLPPHHPDAVHNRRDLRLTNRVLGNHRWLARTLENFVRPNETALELGAGTGEFGRRLARRGIAVDGLDLWPRPADWPSARAWHVADLRTFSGYHAYRVVFGNLIFHQFADAHLGQLGANLRPHARVVIACEPARRRSSQWLYRGFLHLCGANYVSRHDGHVSIAAGFRAAELPQLLGLDAPAWDVQLSTTLLGLYRMVAVRRAHDFTASD